MPKKDNQSIDIEFSEIEKSFGKKLRAMEDTLLELRIREGYVPNEDFVKKETALFAEGLVIEAIERLKSEILILSAMSQLFEQAFGDIDTLKQAIQNTGIKNKSIAKKVNDIQTWKDSYTPLFNLINERIKAQEDLEKFEKGWREENK